MTPGERLLVQQISLVAHARKWDLKKTVQKLALVMTHLQQAVPGKSAAVKPPPPKKEDQKLIDEAESIIKALFKEPPDPST